MTGLKPPIALTLAAAIAAGNVCDPQTFKDAPPLAAVPSFVGFSVTGPTGPGYAAVERVDAVTDQQLSRIGPQGPSSQTMTRPPLLPTGPTGLNYKV